MGTSTNTISSRVRRQLPAGILADATLRWLVTDRNDLGDENLVAAFSMERDARDWRRDFGHARMRIVEHPWRAR